MGRRGCNIILIVACVLCACEGAASGKTVDYIVYQGRATAQIVAADGAIEQVAAHELRHYLEALSGARPEIVSPREARGAAPIANWILLGEPTANDLVHEAEAKKLVRFEGLKPGGFVLRSAKFYGRRAACVVLFKEAREKALATANKWNERIDYPASDLGVLYRINTHMVTGTELVSELVQNIDNYYHGRNYLQPIDFGKVYTLDPILKRAAWPDV